MTKTLIAQHSFDKASFFGKTFPLIERKGNDICFPTVFYCSKSPLRARPSKCKFLLNRTPLLEISNAKNGLASYIKFEKIHDFVKAARCNPQEKRKRCGRNDDGSEIAGSINAHRRLKPISLPLALPRILRWGLRAASSRLQIGSVELPQKKL